MTWIIPPHISEREEAHVWPNGMYWWTTDSPVDCEECRAEMEDVK